MSTQGIDQRPKQNLNRLSEFIQQNQNQLRVLMMGDASKRLGRLDNGRTSMQKNSQPTRRALALKCGHCLVRRIVWRGVECDIIKSRCLGCVWLLFLPRGAAVPTRNNNVCALTFICASCAIVWDMINHLHVHRQNEDSDCWMQDSSEVNYNRFPVQLHARPVNQQRLSPSNYPFNGVISL